MSLFSMQNVSYFDNQTQIIQKTSLNIEKGTVTALLGELRTLPPNFTEDMIMKAPSNDIMNKLARGVLASYSYDMDPENRDVKNVMRQCIELISRFSTLAAYGYQARRRYYENQSMYIHNPISTLSTAENFLHLIRPTGEYTNCINCSH